MSEPSTKKRKMTWGDFETQSLLKAYHHFRSGKPTSGHELSETKWTAIAKRMTEETGIQFDPYSCKSQWASLRKEYKIWTDSQASHDSESKDSLKFGSDKGSVLRGDHVSPILMTPDQVVALLKEDGQWEEQNTKENNISSAKINDSTRGARPKKGVQCKRAGRNRRLRVATWNNRSATLSSLLFKMDALRAERDERRLKASMEMNSETVEVQREALQVQREILEAQREQTRLLRRAVDMLGEILNGNRSLVVNS